MPPPTAPSESPLFSRLSDLLLWLTQRTEKFPRTQRFLLANRLMDTAFACHEQLIRARKVAGVLRADALLQADIQLETLRLQLRLAHELRCITMQQYEHGAGLINEVGRLLGSWRKERS